MCDIFDDFKDIITKSSIVLVDTNISSWKGEVVRNNFSDLSSDYNHLKVILINTKKKDRVLIKITLWNKQKIVPVATQKYYHGAHMEESVHDITLKIRNQKKGMTTNNINNYMGYFFVKLHGVEAENHF